MYGLEDVLVDVILSLGIRVTKVGSGDMRSVYLVF